jgi:hypothetical protein
MSQSFLKFLLSVVIILLFYYCYYYYFIADCPTLSRREKLGRFTCLNEFLQLISKNSICFQPPKASAVPDDRIPCPHCNRRFAQQGSRIPRILITFIQPPSAIFQNATVLSPEQDDERTSLINTIIWLEFVCFVFCFCPYEV